MPLYRQNELYEVCQKIVPELNWTTIFLKHHLAISHDNPRQIAYSKEGTNPHDDKKRIRTTLGKYLAKHHDIHLPDLIINKIIGFIHDEWTILKGDDIVEAYKEGVGCNSCMTGSDQSHIIKWYANCSNVSLLVWCRRARALLWNTNKGLYIDRVYSGDHTANEAYESYAEKNGINYTYKQGNFEGLTVKANIETPIPYMDTFHYSDGKILKTGEDIYILNSTEGLLQELILCPHCERHSELEYEVDGEMVCERCYNNSSYCDDCESSTFSETILIDSSYYCEGCAESANDCHNCGLTFRDVQEIDDKDYCNSCASEAIECENCKELTFKPEIIENDEYCESCASKALTCDCGTRTFNESCMNCD